MSSSSAAKDDVRLASVASGTLSKTCAFEAKVSTCPKTESPNSQHVLCLYMPDVYDKAKVTEVMKILLGEHGMNLSGVKSNLYTAIGAYDVTVRVYANVPCICCQGLTASTRVAYNLQSVFLFQLHKRYSQMNEFIQVWKNTSLLKDAEIKVNLTPFQLQYCCLLIFTFEICRNSKIIISPI